MLRSSSFLKRTVCTPEMALTTVDLPCATCPIVPAIDQGGGWVGRGGAMARVRQRGAWRGGGREEARVARRIERRTMMIGSLTLRPSSRAIDRSFEARRAIAGTHRC
eukprot:30919-Pelagococcus_subviridis.AAC.8